MFHDPSLFLPSSSFLYECEKFKSWRKALIRWDRKAGTQRRPKRVLRHKKHFPKRANKAACQASGRLFLSLWLAGGGEGQLCFASQRRSFPTRERGWSLRRCVSFPWQASHEKSRLQMKFCCKSFAKQMKITHIIVPKSVDWISRVGGQMLTIDDKGGHNMQIPLHHIMKRTCLTSW